MKYDLLRPAKYNNYKYHAALRCLVAVYPLADEVAATHHNGGEASESPKFYELNSEKRKTQYRVCAPHPQGTAA